VGQERQAARADGEALHDAAVLDAQDGGVAGAQQPDAGVVGDERLGVPGVGMRLSEIS
jgi:hypothetical protein